MFTLWNELRDAGFGELARSFASMDQLQREIDRRLQTGPSAAPRELHSSRMHVHEGASALVVRLEVPGFRQEDLEVTVTGDVLSIRGEREAKLPKEYAVRYRERGALGINRNFRLPRRVDTQRIEAALRNGVLTLTIPRAVEAQPKRIEVKTQS